MPHSTVTPTTPAASTRDDTPSHAGAHRAHRAHGTQAGHAAMGAPMGAPMMQASYGRFAAMLLTSTTVMFGLMYSMVYQSAHLRWSETRFWMALYMGAAMTIIMLAFMLGMYADRRKNVAIFAGAAFVFGGGLYLARSQRTVDDVAWMKAMIPHHSIALTTSSRAQLTDPRVKRLAQQIIESQTREIAEMETLIAELEQQKVRR